MYVYLLIDASFFLLRFAACKTSPTPPSRSATRIQTVYIFIDLVIDLVICIVICICISLYLCSYPYVFFLRRFVACKTN